MPASEPGADDDRLLTLAFALDSNPGAYALLIGAGVSKGAGLPSAWDVITSLTAQLARLRNERPADPVQWYEQTFAEKASYDLVLKRIAPASYERQPLLRKQFERSEGGNGSPSTAHHAIADLVAIGAVKVIVTLNFDRLIEAALRQAGIEPTVIVTDADIDGMPALHAIDCCVVHLHGDYLNPDSMLNTDDELAEYSVQRQQVLEQVLRDYGLIAVGWSATYDTALRRVVAASYRDRYTFTWIEPYEQSQLASDLARLKNASTVKMPADDGLGRLADGVQSLRARNARHPLTVSTAIETAKRELAGGNVRIGLHDTLASEFRRLHALEDIRNPTGSSDESYSDITARIDEASTVACGLIATLAFWGDAGTDRWWLGELRRFGVVGQGGGATLLLERRLVAGASMFYAAGVAAVARERYDLLNRLFSMNQLDHQRTAEESFARQLGADNFPSPGRPRNVVLPILDEVLGVPDEGLDQWWQEFEILRYAYLVMRSPSYRQLYEEYQSYELQRTNALKTAAELRLGVVPDQAREYEQRAAAAASDSAFAMRSIVGLVWPGSVHVMATRGATREPVIPVALQLAADVEAEGQSHPLVASGFAESPIPLVVALRAVSIALGSRGDEIARMNQEGYIRMSVWLDGGDS
ncbi:SIR2 family protein [Leifsonia xyli]|uniref:SIR2 family protein n=1 Tax=Leifsonia xyli TaxID=1575 RepID=UPI003D680056